MDNEDNFIFVGDAYNIPKTNKAPSEDAFFQTVKGVGISDGVGGWNNYGIECYRFSNTLMQECQKIITKMIFHQNQSRGKRFTIQEIECRRQALESNY